MRIDKQIENTRAISKEIQKTGLGEHLCDAIAVSVNDAGYRKASEVVEEVRKSLPSIREFNSSEIAIGYEWALADVRKAIAELEKKYTEGKR